MKKELIIDRNEIQISATLKQGLMILATLPANEELRLKELHSLDILDTENEVDYDELIELAGHICGCDISFVSFVDKHRQWFKAKKGLSRSETPRDISFCAHTILEKEVLIVEDALTDIRFCDNPSVINGSIRFYAGAPIRVGDDLCLGTVCVADTQPRKLTKEQANALASLARHASRFIELRRKNRLLKDTAIEQQLLREKAEKASKAQEQFLSTMSHEIRTPLNGVIGMIDLLSQNAPRPDQVPDLSLLKSASENLLHIVNDILDYNKIETGNFNIERTGFDLRETIFEIEKIHELKAKQKAIELVMSYDPQIPAVVVGDPARIKQVLNNLIDNAIKFTEAGSVTVDVELFKNEKNASAILFKIKDTGIGIEEDKVQTIFDRFFQANSNTTRKFGGTGLGLAITKRILELMKSEIQLQSIPGVGSCFSFVVTLDKIEQQSLAAELGSCQIVQKLTNVEILVAEDNKMNKVLIERFLKKWEVKADFAINGLEAIDKVSKKDYDLILMDLQMPEMDGYEATTYIRSKLKKDVPIIAMTADALFSANVHLNSGALTDYVLKPFNSTILFKKIYDYTLGSKHI